jgi:hypothetical protein
MIVCALSPVVPVVVVVFWVVGWVDVGFTGELVGAEDVDGLFDQRGDGGEVTGRQTVVVDATVVVDGDVDIEGSPVNGDLIRWRPGGAWCTR